MNNILKIFNKAKWLIGGNFIFAFSQWFILLVIARLSSKNFLGQYSLSLAVVTTVFAISNLQLRPLYILDANSLKMNHYSDYYYIRLFTSLVAVAFCLLSYFLIDVYFTILLFVIFIKFFDSLSDIIYSFYNAENLTQLISRSLILKGFSSMMVVLFGFYFFDFELAFIFYALIYFLIWFFLDNKFIKKSIIFNRPNINKKILIKAIPMGFSLGIVTAQSNIPKFMLEKYINTESVGVFTVLSYFIIMGSIFINSICQYLSPKISSSWINNKVDFSIYWRYMLFGSFLIGLLGVLSSFLFGGFFMSFFYGDSFLIYTDNLRGIMVCGIFLYLSTVSGYVLTAIDFIKGQVYIFSVLIFVTFVACSFFIPRFGLDGAIYSIGISYFLQFVLSTLVIHHKMKGGKS